MKRLILLLYIPMLVSCSNSHKAKLNKPELTLSIIRSYDTNFNIQPPRQFSASDIKLKISNPNFSTISFWLMKCSWQENFIVNNDYEEIFHPDCDNNFPILLSLDYNESIEFKMTLGKINNTLYSHIKSTKLGIIYIDGTKHKNDQEYYDIMGDKSKQEEVIWSNPIFLNDEND